MTPRPPFISFIKKQEKWSGVASLTARSINIIIIDTIRGFATV